LLAGAKATVQFEQLHQIDDRVFPIEIFALVGSKFREDCFDVNSRDRLARRCSSRPRRRDAEGDEKAGEADPAPGVTLAACLEPKMADTMLPKTLILSSYVVAFSSFRAAPRARSCASRAAMGRGFDARLRICLSPVTTICKRERCDSGMAVPRYSRRIA
jgi:hypothetical protein